MRSRIWILPLLVIMFIPILMLEGENGTGDVNLTVTVDPPPSPPPSPPPYFPPTPSNKLPIAEAGSDQVAFIGEIVQFIGANSKDLDGYIVNYEWDFGDGSKASGVNVSHKYLEVGNYIVALTVMDDKYGIDTDKCAIIVKDYPIIIPPLPPVLSNLTIIPTELELGEDVTISLYIENPNNESINYIVTMEIGWLTLLTDVDLEANETRIISRTVTRGSIGEYNVTVNGMSGSFIVTIPPNPAEFVISSLTITPEEIVEGEVVNVTIVITNIGDEAGNFSSEVVVLDGEYSTEFTIELLGGETTIITFDYLVEIIGTHTIKIDNLTASFTVSPHPLKPAEFLWANFTCASEILEGEPLEVSFDVINTGEVAGDAVVTMRIKEIDLSHVMGVLLEPQGGSTQHWISFHSFLVRSYTVQVVGSSGVIFFEDTFDVVPKPIPIWEREWFYPMVALVFVIIGAIGIYIYYRKTDFSGWT